MIASEGVQESERIEFLGLFGGEYVNTSFEAEISYR